MEYLAGEPGGQEAETVPLLAFSHSQEADKARKTPDVKIVYKDTLDPASPTSSSLSLNLTITCWMPLAESSRVLMKKSLDKIEIMAGQNLGGPDVRHEVGEAEEAVGLSMLPPLLMKHQH